MCNVLVRLVLVLLPLCAVAQGDTITIHGKVLDLYFNTPVPGLNVINSSRGSTVLTHADGRFDIVCDRHDVIFLFLTGYQTKKFCMADSGQQQVYEPLFFLDRLTYSSKPIIVQPKKSLDKIEEERKKLGYIPRELRQPETYYTSPISALYELLSNKAQERNKLRKQVQEDDRRRVFRELFDYYKQAGLFDLPEDQYEPFIDYLNLPVEFLKYKTDYEITKTVMDAYRMYGVQRGFIK